MAYFRVGPSGGTRYSETLLWSNPSPTASYQGGGTSLPTSTSMNQFDYIKVTYRVSTTDANTRSVIVTYTDFVANGGGSNVGTMIGTNVAARPFGYANDNNILFGYCYQFASANATSSNTIPLAVYGIKKVSSSGTTPPGTLVFHCAMDMTVTNGGGIIGIPKELTEIYKYFKLSGMAGYGYCDQIGYNTITGLSTTKHAFSDYSFSSCLYFVGPINTSNYGTVTLTVE